MALDRRYFGVSSMLVKGGQKRLRNAKKAVSNHGKHLYRCHAGLSRFPPLGSAVAQVRSPMVLGTLAALRLTSTYRVLPVPPSRSPPPHLAARFDDRTYCSKTQTGGGPDTILFKDTAGGGGVPVALK